MLAYSLDAVNSGAFTSAKLNIASGGGIFVRQPNRFDEDSANVTNVRQKRFFLFTTCFSASQWHGEVFFTHASDTICKLLHTMRRPVEGSSWPGGIRALSVYPEFSTPLLESKIFFYTERRHRTCYRWAILRISRLKRSRFGRVICVFFEAQ